MSGITITGGIQVFGMGASFTGAGSPTPPGPSGFDNVIGYNELNPPIIPGQQTEDPTATVNGTTGITINNASYTGIAVPGLTASNQLWFSTNYTTPSSHTVTWGPGSTVASSTVNVVQLTGSNMVF